MQKEKENLLKEIDKSITEKLKLKSELEIKKQKLELNEFSIKNLKNKNNIENAVDNSDMLEMEKIIQEKNDELNKLREKINLFEKKNGDLGLGIIQEENKNLLKEMDEKLKKVKNFYEEEIKRLKDEFKKEKDNYDLIIRVKDDEIMRLVKNKEDLYTVELEMGNLDVNVKDDGNSILNKINQMKHKKQKDKTNINNSKVHRNSQKNNNNHKIKKRESRKRKERKTWKRNKRKRRKRRKRKERKTRKRESNKWIKEKGKN